jgi:hypothetical protein
LLKIAKKYIYSVFEYFKNVFTRQMYHISRFFMHFIYFTVQRPSESIVNSFQTAFF